MQAVIMAAGRSTRTHPLTVTRPKPLLEVLDRAIIEHNLAQLDGLVDEAVVVVGYRQEMIVERLGSSWAGLPLQFVEQGKQLGTGHALLAARHALGARFLVLNGDDLFARPDLEALVRHDQAILVREVDDVRRFGAVMVDGDKVGEIVEKPSEQVSRLANVGAYTLTRDIFDIQLEQGERREYELPEWVNALARRGAVRYEVVGDYWLPVSYPWNYLEANVALLRRLADAQPAGSVHETAVIEGGVTIQGPVFVGSGTVVRSGTYIEGPVWIGPGCVIGPHAYLRPDTILLAGVRTRAEIVDAVLMRRCTAKHYCYVGHSVFGEDCNVAAGTITADYRHDGGSNWSMIKGQRVDSGRRKLGAFVGDGVRLGVGTLIYPGRKIWPAMTTLPGQVVERDLAP